MARYVDGDKLMEHWQEWDWWDNKGMPHSFGYIPDKALERALDNPLELRQLTHAHWIEEEDCSVVTDIPWSMCAACGEYSPKLLYCAFCGAKMDEEEQ